MSAGDARLVAAMRHAVDAVVVVDAAGRVMAVSPSAPRIFGYDPEVVEGMNALDLVHPDDLVLAVDALAGTAGRTGRMEPLAVRIQDGGGRWRPVTLVAVNRLDDPEVGGVVLTVRDQTGMAEQERRLDERDDRYRQVVELAADGAMVIDEEGRITFMTGRMAALLGLDAGETVGRPLTELGPPDGGDELRDQLERWRLGISESFPAELVHRSGDLLRVRISAAPAFDHGGTYLGCVAMVSDLTEVTREGERVARAEAAHRATLAALPDLVFRLSAAGELTAFHANSQELPFAEDPANLPGRNVREFVTAEVGDSVMEAIGAVLASGEVRTFEHELDLEGGPAVFEARIARVGPDDVVALVRDVTEVRAAEAARRALAIEVEQRRAEAQVREERERAARMESLGRLAGGLAHDINNLLGVIGNYAGALAPVVDDEEARGDVRAIEDAVRRGSDLTRRLLMLGRGEYPRRARVDLADLVREVEPALRAAAPGRRLRVLVPERSCPVVADCGRMEQALVNLVSNAADASGSGDLVEVALVTATSDAGDPVLRLTVRDRGSGMSPAVLERAFDPYFTTKGPERGTGLGLSVVHGAVSDAGGEVRIEQPDDGGTLVVLDLPAAAPAARRGTVGAGGNRPTVLVVDDEPDALRSVSRLLETLGFGVVVCSSGAEAVARLRGADDVDAVLSDVVMPHMTGPALAAELRSVRPDLPVVLMTAVDADVLGGVDGGPAVLAKPLDPDEVEQVLLGAVTQSVGASDAKARARSMPA